MVISAVATIRKYQNLEQPSPAIVNSAPYTDLSTNIRSTPTSLNEDQTGAATDTGKQF